MLSIILSADYIEGHNLCSACGLENHSPSVVVSRGDPTARLMVIGEAPGEKEDLLLEPFVGRSGLLLDKMLLDAGIDSQKDVYICNAVKCRPPKNRRPTKTELQASEPWLCQQIKLVDPWVIVLAGSTAVEAVLGIKDAISTLRGVWHSWNGIMVMPLFHPAYLLRNPSKADGSPIALTFADLLEVRSRLEKLKSSTCNQIADLHRGGN